MFFCHGRNSVRSADVGGLLISMPMEDGMKAAEEMKSLGLPCGLVGRIEKRREKTVYVR